MVSLGLRAERIRAERIRAQLTRFTPSHARLSRHAGVIVSL
jgi:hypothetical protein